MQVNYIKYYFLIFLGIGMLLNSCTSEDIIVPSEEEENLFIDDFSLSFSVFLDKMGGEENTRAFDDDFLTEYENYIDLEKFRVLFFNSEDKFLFESKSRWVKKMSEGEGSTWFVSVPLFTYGNEDEWNWDGIRTQLTSGKFKIAILANRPGTIYFPDFDDNTLGEAKWFDNSGPNWTPDNSVCGGTKIKTVFDLLHSQWDPIYHSKGNTSGWSENGYKFIMGTNEAGELTMSSTSNWVTVEKSSTTVSGVRDFITPDFDHPIPMYGIQEYQQIDNWEKGTTFNLERSSDKAISMLRSVVKLELLIPKSKVTTQPSYVAIAYPNVYARCEPINVWTPTDQLWAEAEKKASSGYCNEIDKIMSYGPLCLTTDAANSTITDFQKRYSWFYGAWKEKWEWPLNNLNNNGVSGYPQIFNSCIQRNAVVGARNTLINDNTYWRYVVYTGERNISDTSKLNTLGNDGSGQPTVMYWMFNNGNKLYGIPITDYSLSGNPARSIAADTYSSNTVKKVAYLNDTYMQKVMTLTGSSNKQFLPWPLVRNHVYRIYVGATNIGTTKAGVETEPETLQDLGIECQDLHSESLSAPTIKSLSISSR